MNEPCPSHRPEPAPSAPPAGARDVVEGIPDRAARRPAWKYLLLAGVFLLWVALLTGLYFWARP